jgi:hypothetical protein
MKNKKETLTISTNKKYVKPDLERIAIDHEISLVMMSESGEPPPEFISKLSRTFILK